MGTAPGWPWSCLHTGQVLNIQSSNFHIHKTILDPGVPGNKVPYPYLTVAFLGVHPTRSGMEVHPVKHLVSEAVWPGRRWAGHEFPTLLVLAVFGSFISYIYSAPPLKLKQSGWAGNYALGSSYIALPWWAGQV